MSTDEPKTASEVRAEPVIEGTPFPTIVQVPDNPTGDAWIHLFHAMVMKYAQPPLDIDPEILEHEVRTRKSAVLGQYGLHLNV